LRNPYEYAFNHPTLEKVLNKLTARQFFSENSLEITNDYKDATELNDEEVAHAALIASFLALSKVDRHKQRALAFAILLYLQKKDCQEYSSYCYIIFSRTGNIQLGKHLSELFDESGDSFRIAFDEVLNAELSTKRSISVLPMAGLQSIHLSDFQKKIWEELQTKKRILGITGPTSSGKSYVMQSYILKLSKRKSAFRVLYMVPTRALISEVSSKLRKSLFSNNVSVKIGVGEENEEKNREVLVLTPERCLKLLRDSSKAKNIDLIFCDEFQKIEDPERGVLLEYVLYELINTYKRAKVVIAGPYLKNLKGTIDDLGRLKSETIESEVAPVYQLKSVFRVPNRKNEKIGVALKKGNKRDVPILISIERPTDYKVKRQSEVVARIIKTYAAKSNNVIYAPTRAKAEEIALALANVSEETNDARLSDLVKLLEKEIHPDFSLVRCLRRGVAFHHSMIPEMAKLEIEDLYRQEAIRNVACTTTLLEGVNLPADRVFIYRPWKRNRNYPLTGFDFGNLIGRAGRTDVRLNGSVYCIELGGEKWADEKLDSDPGKELMPATSGVIKRNIGILEENITKNSIEMFHNDAKAATVFTVLLLRQKALKDKANYGINELVSYLRRKHLTNSQVNKISVPISQSVCNLEIPYRITKLNPTIDPVLQNVLYNEIMSNRKQWIIDKKVRETVVGVDGESKDGSVGEFKDKSFYYQFQDIVRRLDNIFKIEATITSKQRYRRWYRWPNIYILTHYGVTWLEQKQLSFIITTEMKEVEGKNKRVVDELKHIKELFKEDPARLEIERLKIVDKLIREVVEHIHSNVRYYLAKYVKLWIDILDCIFSEDEKQLYAQTLMIPEMLELGAYMPHVLELIRAGVPRSAAIQAGYKLERSEPNFQGDTIAWLLEHNQLLDPVYRKHLERVGFASS
jgi:hypothetical protein